jgi:malto-oligosyltrehalose trehalohydrolase
MSKPFGTHVSSRGTSFGIWAPAAKSVALLIGCDEQGCTTADPLSMVRESDGWHRMTLEDACAGARYKYRIDNELDVPDPASFFQPNDVSGPSEIIDHTEYRWRANTWKGRRWQDAAILEAHVGTFTPEGTYLAIIDKLDHLVATGITALELMPLNDFAGRRNWGYDGVLWYAPHGSYGRPNELKALIDEAHIRGLMVFLDVVYNHFGPEGNYLGRYAPSFFTNANTPWGNAIDYRVPQVRDFAIQNALYWLRDYRFDGLRLDAVHAITEVGDRHLLHDLSASVGEFARQSGREIHLVLENDDNSASLLAPLIDPPDGLYRAQWNDDYHHSWHVLLTGEHGGYYRDYAPAPDEHIRRAMQSGFAYQGETSAHRDGKPRGEASGMLSPMAFVNFLQNHDQIGNRPLGDRLESIAEPRAIEAALAITLLAPMPPMLFMGEEWGSTQPFAFFCDFKGGLAKAVRAGRRREFKSAYEKYGDDIPDPLDEATFRAAKLDWDSSTQKPGSDRLSLVSSLLALRQRHITPDLARMHFDPTSLATASSVIAAHWCIGEYKKLLLLANLSPEAASNPRSDHRGSAIWGGNPSDVLPPWSVFWGTLSTTDASKD